MMRLLYIIFVGSAALCLLPGAALAQGTISFVTGYPKTGSTVKKSIAIKGVVVPDVGWTLKTVRIEAWEGGKDVLYYEIKDIQNNRFPDNGVTWGTLEQAMPNGNTFYWIVVTAIMNDGTTDRIIRTNSKEIKSNSP